jgi:hypothetical protein
MASRNSNSITKIKLTLRIINNFDFCIRFSTSLFFIHICGMKTLLKK